MNRHLRAARTANASHSKGRPSDPWVRFVLRPGGNLLAVPFIARGVHPNTVTWLSLLIGLVGVAVIPFGWFALAVGCLLVRSLLDYADGTVARATSKQSHWGRYLDGVAGKVLYAARWLAIALWALSSYEGPGTGYVAVIAATVPSFYLLTKHLSMRGRLYRVMLEKKAARRETPQRDDAQHAAGSGQQPQPHRQQGLVATAFAVDGFVQMATRSLDFLLFAIAALAGRLELYVIYSLVVVTLELARTVLRAFVQVRPALEALGDVTGR